jgi:hypothetical protein
MVCRATRSTLQRQETNPMARDQVLTLLDVIQAVSEEAANEQEILATVVHLISSGQVRLSDEAIRAIKDLCTPADVAA